MYKVKRMYEHYKGGKTYIRSDTDIVEDSLQGYIDHYSGGELEHLKDEVRNLRTAMAELMVHFHGKEVVDLCAEEEKK
jgi:hypothetical protein